jgi:hypothetical protein
MCGMLKFTGRQIGQSEILLVRVLGTKVYAAPKMIWWKKRKLIFVCKQRRPVLRPVALYLNGRCLINHEGAGWSASL